MLATLTYSFHRFHSTGDASPPCELAWRGGQWAQWVQCSGDPRSSNWADDWTDWTDDCSASGSPRWVLSATELKESSWSNRTKSWDLSWSSWRLVLKPRPHISEVHSEWTLPAKMDCIQVHSWVTCCAWCERSSPEHLLKQSCPVLLAVFITWHSQDCTAVFMWVLGKGISGPFEREHPLELNSLRLVQQGHKHFPARSKRKNMKRMKKT